MAAQGKTVLDAGGAIVEILGTSGFLGSAQPNDLNAWITTYDLNVTSMIDAPDAQGQTLSALTVRETLLIVEMPSMRVVWQVRGDTGGTDPSSIVAGTAEILRLLGP